MASKSRAGEIKPGSWWRSASRENMYRDSDIEYRLIGSLKRYDWEPTNEIFFKTYKKCDSQGYVTLPDATKYFLNLTKSISI